MSLCREVLQDIAANLGGKATKEFDRVTHGGSLLVNAAVSILVDAIAKQSESI